ncbi:hypothetical protein StoSoilB13_14190 [Arthrobacter sp. StoSoilB13]|nr:hypothetical protein StoSoilB13_14190 [Arthrobacter sp. StoSoilB13]
MVPSDPVDDTMEPVVSRRTGGQHHCHRRPISGEPPEGAGKTNRTLDLGDGFSSQSSESVVMTYRCAWNEPLPSVVVQYEPVPTDVAQGSPEGNAAAQYQCELSSGDSPKPVRKVQAGELDTHALGYFRFTGQGALSRKLRFQIFKERVPSHMVTIGPVARGSNRNRIFPS